MFSLELMQSKLIIQCDATLEIENFMILITIVLSAYRNIQYYILKYVVNLLYFQSHIWMRFKKINSIEFCSCVLFVWNQFDRNEPFFLSIFLTVLVPETLNIEEFNFNENFANEFNELNWNKLFNNHWYHEKKFQENLDSHKLCVQSFTFIF